MDSSKDKLLFAHNMGYRITEKGEILNPKGIKIKGSKNKEGRVFINIRYLNNFIRIPAHRLQAYQKFGSEIFDKNLVIRHLNGIKSDNSFLNIEIGTQSDNMMDIPIDIRIANAKHASSFLKKYDYEKIIDFYHKNKSYKKTMNEFNITNKGTLNYIIKRKDY